MLKKITISLIFLINITGMFIPQINYVVSIVTIALSIFIFILLNKTSSEIEEHISTAEEIPIVIENIDESLPEPIVTIPCEKYLEKVFYIKECIPIIEKFSLNTREYEERVLQDLFKEFEEIWKESDIIVKNSESSMKSIFDPEIRDNLGYVLNASNEINNDFSQFMPVLKVMSQLADKFISTSIESFNTVTRTTKDIVDLAEQVKVISINVRIEAARVKDSGGFNILGNDISNFAERTSEVASITNKKIKETMSDIIDLKDELTKQLNNVEGMAENIFTKVSPFEGILRESSKAVMDVIKNLNIISEELQENLKKSISKMQYQDITNQETGHLIQLLKQIEDLDLINDNFKDTLGLEKQNEIRTDIINYLGDISTTLTEENEISNLAKEWGIEVIHENITSGKETDDGVFLF